MHSKIDAVIYDLDGTLIDSAKSVAGLLNELRADLFKPSLKTKDFFPWISLGGEDLIRNALDISNPNLIKEYLAVFRARYMHLTIPQDSVFPMVHETLSKLEALGVRVAICTNKPRNLAEKVLRETGISRYISFMCAGGDLLTRKPHPDNLKVCIDYFEVNPSSALLVGDSVVDQQIADNCGAKFCHFELGYDDGIDKSNVHYSIDRHDKLLELL